MRGSIVRRGSGWLLKYDLPRVDGVRHQRYARVLGTYKDAQKKLTELLNAVDTNVHVVPNRMTSGMVWRARPRRRLRRWRGTASWPRTRSPRT